MAKKVWLSLAVGSALVVTSACSSDNKTSTDTKGATATTAPSASATPTAAKTPEKPVKLVLFSGLGTDKFPDGQSEQNNPYIKKLNEKLNLDIQWVAPPSTAAGEKLNVMLASGEELDVIHGNSAAWVRDMVAKKGLAPLNDALDKYGANIKKAIPKEAWDNVTVDGKIYAVPKGQINPPEVIYIRKDWLDKLGLSVPKTIEEYENVMRQFATKDPDGNGKADTFGTTFIGTTYESTTTFFGAFGVNFNQGAVSTTFTMKDGQLVPSVIQPEAKEALTWFNKLYADKILDPEFALNKADSFANKVAQGKVGLISSGYSVTRTFIADSIKNDPKANWIMIDPPKGKNGAMGSAFNDPYSSPVTAVHVNSKKADSVIKLLDYVFSDEGYKLVKFGIEGDVWKMNNGKLEIDADKSLRDNYRQRLSLVETTNDELNFLRLNALGENFKLVDNYKLGMKYKLPNAYTGMPTATMSKAGGDLRNLTFETFTKMIMGNTPLADFDKFVDSFNKMGGTDMVKEVNKK